MYAGGGVLGWPLSVDLKAYRDGCPLEADYGVTKRPCVYYIYYPYCVV